MSSQVFLCTARVQWTLFRAYIKGKNDPESITYDCPQLEPILAPTYGCIVYQEQVMQIVRDLAGYTWGGADLVRRAMSKKKGELSWRRSARTLSMEIRKKMYRAVLQDGIDEKDGKQDL